MAGHRTTRLGLAALACAAALNAAHAAADPGEPAAPARAAKHLAPIPEATLALMRARDTGPAAPILVRVFKKEAELEVWKQARGGGYVLLKTFPICRWSGQLGPKRRQGDRQAPEGFYAVTPALMNPNSAHYLSFDTGFPNAYDRAQGATGSALMVHGTCSSAGCFAMTDAGIAEIYALAREAFEGGQKAFQFHAYPFRMSAENMVKHRADPNIAFWRQLKEGYDRFEASREALAITVSGGRYAFGRSDDRLATLRVREEERMQQLLASGLPAVRTTYADGGQHGYFTALAAKGVALGEVSQPETLAYAGREVALAPQPAMRIAAAALFGPLPAAPRAADDRTAPAPMSAEALKGPRLPSAFAHPVPAVVASPLPSPEPPPLRLAAQIPLPAPEGPAPEATGLLRFASASLMTPAHAAAVETAAPIATGSLQRALSVGPVAAEPRRRLAGSIPPLSETGLLGLLSMALVLAYPGLQHLRARRLAGG